MSETRNITCPICGNTTDNSGNSLGTVTMPDGTPEARWSVVLGQYMCDRSTCAITYQTSLTQNEATQQAILRRILLHGIFGAIQSDVQAGKTLNQALADVMTQLNG
jgi:hypothetical protein